MEQNSIVTRIHIGASRLRILGLGLIILAFVLFIYFTRKQEQNIQIQRNEIFEKDAAIIEKDSAIKEIAVVRTRQDELASVVKEYVRLRNEHDVNALDRLYAERLDYYFKNLRNCPKSEVKQADATYWSRFPKESFTIDNEPEIAINSDGTARAIVNGRNCREVGRCSDVLVEILFDKENKIKAVRAFIPSG